LALEFALADVADIGADHEAEQMLGIDALSMKARWKQRGEYDGRLKRFRTNWHSHSENHWGGWKVTEALTESASYHDAKSAARNRNA
jgi:hypothetical protein